MGDGGDDNSQLQLPHEKQETTVEMGEEDEDLITRTTFNNRVSRKC